MDAEIKAPEEEKKARRSRYAPGRRKTRIVINDRDIKQFAVRNHYPYLTDRWVTALIGGNPEALTRRNLQLKEEPAYLKVCDSQASTEDARSESLKDSLVLQNTPLAEKLLIERGHVIADEEYTGHFEHRCYSCEIRVRFELAGKHHKLPLIEWPAVRAYMPNPAQDAYAVPFLSKLTGQKEKKRSDCFPLGFDGLPPLPNGQPYRPFFAIEAHRGTMPVNTSDMTRSSLKHHVLEYIDIIEQEAFANHYGFGFYYPTFIVNHHATVFTLQDVIIETTVHKPSLRRHFLIDVHTEENSKNPAPMSLVFQRAGMEPLNLLKPERR
jgi:hypothetical protein